MESSRAEGVRMAPRPGPHGTISRPGGLGPVHARGTQGAGTVRRPRPLGRPTLRRPRGAVGGRHQGSGAIAAHIAAFAIGCRRPLPPGSILLPAPSRVPLAAHPRPPNDGPIESANRPAVVGNRQRPRRLGAIRSIGPLRLTRREPRELKGVGSVQRRREATGRGSSSPSCRSWGEARDAGRGIGASIIRGSIDPGAAARPQRVAHAAGRHRAGEGRRCQRRGRWRDGGAVRAVLWRSGDRVAAHRSPRAPAGAGRDGTPSQCPERRPRGAGRGRPARRGLVLLPAGRRGRRTATGPRGRAPGARRRAPSRRGPLALRPAAAGGRHPAGRPRPSSRPRPGRRRSARDSKAGAARGGPWPQCSREPTCARPAIGTQ
jgi:hypothetical protein